MAKNRDYEIDDFDDFDDFDLPEDGEAVEPLLDDLLSGKSEEKPEKPEPENEKESGHADGADEAEPSEGDGTEPVTVEKISEEISADQPDKKEEIPADQPDKAENNETETGNNFPAETEELEDDFSVGESHEESDTEKKEPEAKEEPPAEEKIPKKERKKDKRKRKKKETVKQRVAERLQEKHRLEEAARQEMAAKREMDNTPSDEKPSDQKPSDQKPLEKKSPETEKPEEKPKKKADKAEKRKKTVEKPKKEAWHTPLQKYLDPEWDGKSNGIFPRWFKTVVFFIVLGIILNFLAVLYISKSKNIYFWDDATYWDIARRIAKKPVNAEFWREVYRSVSAEDYNYIAGLMSNVFVRWFGESRLVYVLGIMNCYLIPALICIYWLIKRLGKLPRLTLIMIITLCPVMFFMAISGFVDVGGLILCVICYLLYYGRGRGTELIRHMFIGIILAALVIWRRWYAFFALSFITGMIVDCLLFRRKWYMALASALTAAAVIVFGFRDFLIEKLMQDYGTMYADYKYALSVDVKLVMRYFGALFLLLLAAGSIYAGARKKESRVVFPWVQIAVCFAMFSATQTHGQQHLLLYIPSVVTLIILVTKYITDEKIFAAIFLLMAANSSNVCIPRPQPNNIQEIAHYAVIPDFSMLPLVRDDVNDILALKNKLDGIVKEGETLGVLASSFKINEDILRNVEPSMGYSKNRVEYIAGLPQVDSRDKDVSALYNVSYMLVAEPAQTHLAEGSQTVVTRAVESFALKSDFAAAFEEMPEHEFILDDVTLKLYKRIEEVTPIQKAEFETRLY